MLVSVVADHEVPVRPAIRIAPGDTVEVGERDSQWPAFVFITIAKGSGAEGSGWVPERYLSVDRPLARVVHAYDTKELAASAGTVLELIEDDPESGWSWCTLADG